MKFVDEATITVTAGKGGNGCHSFRREKFVPMGGPDGGNGGSGGSIHLIGREGLNTLADFRHAHHFRAELGERGGSKSCTGRGGQDLFLGVPLGTRVLDVGTHELIGEVTREAETLLVARGGRGGLGNEHFKSSVNRAPRRTTPGEDGEERKLALELQVLADVGLLGLPNAGKSTFLRAVSDARPKVADYPFTTLHPHLGVVRVGESRSFVVADIPGLIEGASQGAGLGILFLRHLKRTRLLLHLVDMAPFDPEQDPVRSIRAIEQELAGFDERFPPEEGGIPLANRERWLVLNKMDLLPEDERSACLQNMREALSWNGPIYTISAISGEGCAALCQDLMRRLETMKNESHE